MKEVLKEIFVGPSSDADRRPHGEPILVVCAIVLDLLLGKTWFTVQFGWWLFLLACIGIPWHIYGITKGRVMEKEVFTKTFPEIVEWQRSHRTFVFLIVYSIFLNYWWKWIY